MKFNKILAICLTAGTLFSCGRTLKDGNYTLQVLSTNDVHGTWFDSTYTGGNVKKSLLAMDYYIDSVRTADGPENVLLLDAGDCLQGDNAAYYFNYVDTLSPHLFPRLVSYMKYDAVSVGNHDVETGHKVYDRIKKDLENAGIAFLAGNYIDDATGNAYFPLYKVFDRAGLKVAVIGYGNANIKAWLTEELWEGISFDRILDRVQADVDAVKAKEAPDVTIILMHSGVGQGDGTVLENESLDVLQAVKGVDFVICGHDHRPRLVNKDSISLMNSGSHSRFVAQGTVDIEVKEGKVVSKSVNSKLIPVNAEKADAAMRAAFQKDYEAVKAFTLTPVGELKTDLRTRDSYKGMSPYINLIHTVSLGCAPAEISLAAPLTYNGTVKAGTLVYNDLFTIYPFENQLFVITMTGQEIKNYLEYSYDQWINTVSGPADHILKIQHNDDPRTQQKGWSFIGRSYNFDSAAGINYTVDVTKPVGERINITTTAHGDVFDVERKYNVAMTSYRASGGGGLLLNGAGIGLDQLPERTVARYPEIREIIYDYLKANGCIDPEAIGNTDIIGHWEFVPASLANPCLNKDMTLLFK